MIPALENHLWQSTLFAGIVGLLTLALRRNRAAVRYGLWLAASLKFLIPLSLLIGLGSDIGWRKTPAAVQPQLAAVEAVGEPFALPVNPPVSAPMPTSPSRLPVVLFAIWLCGFAVTGLAWWWQWRRVLSALRHASPLPMNLPIPVMSTPARLEPGVFGIRNPVLLLPEGILDQLTPEQLKPILLHELCHARRRDNLTAAIHMVVEALFWFHPLVWWIQTRLVEERELACDEEVLRMATEPQDYAEGILNVCKFYLKAPMACVSGVTGSNLKRRVEAIMVNQEKHRLSSGRKLVLAVAGALAVAGPLLFGMLHAPSIHAQSEVAATDRRASFEVASIKFHPGPITYAADPAISGSRVVGTASTLQDLIEEAYGLRGDQIVGEPSWATSDHYDLAAKAAGDETITKDQLRKMLQTLLADRFQFKAHNKTEEVPIYALVIAKGEPKLQLSAPDATTVGFVRSTTGGALHMEATQGTMEKLARQLSVTAGRPVIDQTHLTGGYTYVLEWLPAGRDPSPDAIAPSIFAALQEQLGLRLEPTKGPSEKLVIDRVAKPSAN